MVPFVLSSKNPQTDGRQLYLESIETLRTTGIIDLEKMLGAAKEDYVYSYFCLARHYHNQGDTIKAFSFYEKSIESNNDYDSYLSEYHMVKNKAEREKILVENLYKLRKYANGDDWLAQKRLAAYLSALKKLNDDLVSDSEIISYYEKSANYGSIVALYDLGLIYTKYPEKNPDFKKSLDCFEKFINTGCKDDDLVGRSYCYIGYLHSVYPTNYPNYQKSLDYYFRFLRSGSTNMNLILDVHCRIAGLYYTYPKEAPNYEKSLEYYEKAVLLDAQDDQLMGTAYNKIGYMKEMGLGCNKNEKAAWDAYLKAASKDDISGLHNSGRMYYHGTGTQQDYAKAATYFKKAAEKGYGNSQYLIAMMYLKGQGVEQNDAEFEKFMTLAAKQDIKGAQDQLNNFYRMKIKD